MIAPGSGGGFGACISSCLLMWKQEPSRLTTMINKPSSPTWHACGMLDPNSQKSQQHLLRTGLESTKLGQTATGELFIFSSAFFLMPDGIRVLAQSIIFFLAASCGDLVIDLLASVKLLPTASVVMLLFFFQLGYLFVCMPFSPEIFNFRNCHAVLYQSLPHL